jgi:hypothetical protein
VVATRDLKSYQQFLPVISAGGAPLEATINLASMLVQTQAFSDEVIVELLAVAEEAVRTGDATRLEATYLDVLALGRRYNWGQLVGIVRGAGSLKTLSQIRHLHQVAPDSTLVLAASCVITRQPDRVASYLTEYGPHGMEALSFALHHGAGSLGAVAPTIAGRWHYAPRGGREASTRRRPTRCALCPQQPVHGGRVRSPCSSADSSSRRRAHHRLRRIGLAGLTAAVRAIGALCLSVPHHHQRALPCLGSSLRYELKLVIPVLGSSTPTETMPTKSMSIDLPTITSIVFFFLVQALVFFICRLKLKDIEARKVSPAVKLRLAENEENLFDSGLYVGIAGTCISLVLQVIGVIQANLLAAYSSNLFGILCVAFIKIRHVRPFKQKLILELTESAPAPAAPVAPTAVSIQTARAG